MRGTMHRATGQINQDALTFGRIGNGTAVIGAVSDGHGDPRHYLSHVGASLAVEAARSVLGDMARCPCDKIAPILIDVWQRAVDKHRSRYPAAGSSGRDSFGRVPYGATLLAACLDIGSTHFFQLGDGEIRLGYENGRIDAPFGSGARSPSRVDSLCSLDAVQRVHCLTISGAPMPDFVMLASDGFTKSFRDPGAMDNAAGRLRDFVRRDGMDISEALFECLRNMAEWGSGDDSTIWVAIRTE